jgi:DNA-3-methyladenine glycosylase
MRLRRAFFARDTLTVARDLLGKRLVRVLEGERVSGMIVETEAYVGEEDEASHASPGPTERNASMYKAAGHAYVYLIYGMYHCFNVVTEREGFPAAVLIRALEPLEGVDVMRERRGRIGAGGARSGEDLRKLTGGPGRLCQALVIDRRHDGADLCAAEGSRQALFLEVGECVPDAAVATSPRINVRGDEAAVSAPWRFYVEGNPCVSR